MIPCSLHPATHSLHESVSEREKLGVSSTWQEKGLGKIPAILKFSWIWGLSHSARLTWKSLRGLHLNRAFWNTEYGVALEPLKLISLCRMTVWVMSPQWHARALPSSPGGFDRRRVVVVVGSRSSVFESQVTGEQKRRDWVEDLSESWGAAAKQQFSHVSLIKLVDLRKEMEERPRWSEGDEGLSDEAAEHKVPVSEDWLMQLPWSNQVRVSRQIILTQGHLLCTLTFRDSIALSFLMSLPLTTFMSQNIFEKFGFKHWDCRIPNAAFDLIILVTWRRKCWSFNRQTVKALSLC